MRIFSFGWGRQGARKRRTKVVHRRRGVRAALCAALGAALGAALCAALGAALCGCTSTVATDPFAYAAAPFTASLRGTYTPTEGNSIPVSVVVTYGPPDAGNSKRDLTLVFSEPPSAAGLTVTAVCAADGTRTVTLTYPTGYGTVTAQDPSAFDGYLRLAEALLPLGDEAGRSPRSSEGSFQVTLRRTSDGREAHFTFSLDSPLPLKVRVTDPAGSLELTVS